MDDTTAMFIVMMTVILTFGWIVSSWIRARHGSATSKAAKSGELEAERQIQLLSTENHGLKGQVVRLEERISVLERIATDPAERTAREIEALRATGN